MSEVDTIACQESPDGPSTCDRGTLFTYSYGHLSVHCRRAVRAIATSWYYVTMLLDIRRRSLYAVLRQRILPMSSLRSLQGSEFPARFSCTDQGSNFLLSAAGGALSSAACPADTHQPVPPTNGWRCRAI